MTRAPGGAPRPGVSGGNGGLSRVSGVSGVCQGAGGRVLERGPHDDAWRAHQARMAEPPARAQYRQRKQLPEPVFGLLKEHQGARRFLLRGLAAVQAEWSLLATAFNLRTLARVWRTGGAGGGGPAPEGRLGLNAGSPPTRLTDALGRPPRPTGTGAGVATATGEAATRPF